MVEHVFAPTINCRFSDFDPIVIFGLVDTRVLVDEENNIIKIIIFDSQESRQNRVRKKQILNIQEFRPGRSAMQGHCGLRLFLNNHIVWRTVQYYSASWCLVL